MRVAIAQFNASLGDFEANRQRIEEFVRRSVEKKASLVIFPEASLMGYHPFDLLERPEFFSAQERSFKKLQKSIPSGVGVLIGLITRNPAKKGRNFFNSAALLEKGKKTRFFHKQLLPTGDVFDEARFIEAGDLSDNFFTFKGHRFFVSICEDIWGWPDKKGNSQYAVNPLAMIKGSKLDLVINLSASPYYPGKHETRRQLVAKTASHLKAPMIYCNLVGAQDEIIFDGRSFLMDQKGRELMRAEAFEEDHLVFDLTNLPKPTKTKEIPKAEDLRKALVLGLRDFCQKTGLIKVHLGLSGGVDSAVVLCLAADAVGPGRVRAFYLPTENNLPESQKAAEDLCRNIGVDLKVISIQENFSDLRTLVDQSFGLKDFSVVHENLQSRLRGLLLMAYSNAAGSLLLACGNKDELAAGYSTLYGDLCGGLLPIGDLTKSQVVEIANWYNRDREVIPRFIIERPPSAELRPGQKDEDSLPPYKELDRSVQRLVEENQPIKGSVDQWLAKALFATEFKRWQAPPVLKVSRHAFGRGRRWPIAHGLSKTIKSK